ncbi:MAG: hypothetical protein WC803_05320 [Sphingomonas sp.]
MAPRKTPGRCKARSAIAGQSFAGPGYQDAEPKNTQINRCLNLVRRRVGGIMVDKTKIGRRVAQRYRRQQQRNNQQCGSVITHRTGDPLTMAMLRLYARFGK